MSTLPSYVQALDQPVLRHGDTIALTCPSGYLQAEGHLDLRLWVRDAAPPRDFAGCVFEVLPALQHEARRALGAALDAGRGGAHVRELRRAAAAEEAANARTVLAAAGQPALYGQAVELRHVRGGKFVTVRERALAPLEPNCLRVELDEEGGAGCWLSLLPRLKIRSEGEPVRIGDALLLRAAATQQMLHCSAHNLAPERASPLDAAAAAAAAAAIAGGDADADGISGSATRRREVNVSDAHTAWSVVRYNEYTPSRDTLLLGSTLCLADGARRLCLAATFGEEGEASVASLTAAADLGERVSMVAMPRESDAEPPAGGVWQLLGEVPEGGGVASWERPVLLYNPAARAYLCAATDDATGAPTLQLTRTPEAENAKWELRRAHGDAPTVEERASVLLVNSGGATVIKWEAGGGAAGQGAVAARLVPEEEGSSLDGALSLLPAGAELTHDLGFAAAARDALSSLLRDGVRRPVLAYAVGVDADADAVTLSRQLHDRGRLTDLQDSPRRALAAEAADAGGAAAEDALSSLLQQLARYCNGDAMTGKGGADDDEAAAATVAAAVAGAATAAPPARRQRLLRQLSVLRLLLQLLHELLPPPSRGGVAPALPSPVRTTARRVYSLLVLACRQRPENELYLSKWLPALVEHLPLNVGAEEALTEILSDNRQLLQAQVNGGLLTLFSDLIVEQGKRPSYLHFLKALTACDGVPLDRHQVSVCELLYGERSSALLMEFKADPGEDVDTDPPNVPWPAPPVDAPPPPPRRADTVDSGLLSLTPEGQGVGVDDEDRLLDAEGDVGVAYREALRAATAVPLRGLPRVLVKWEGVENATPKSLYATDWVPLGLVSAAADPGIPQPPPKPSPRGGRTPAAALGTIGEDKDAALSAAGNRRRQLAEYLEAQIELAASLCDGRNYFCIAKLQAVYGYEELLSVAVAARSERLRAAALDLLASLWLDRAPLEPRFCPTLVRGWPATAGDGKVLGGGGAAAVAAAPRGLELLSSLLHHMLDEVTAAGSVPQPVLAAAALRLLRRLATLGFFAAAASLPPLLPRVALLLDSSRAGGAPLPYLRKRGGGAPSTRLGEKLRLALLTPRRLAAGYAQLEDEAAEEEERSAAEAVAAAGSAGRHRADEVSIPWMEARRHACELLLVLVEQHGDEQLSELLAAWEGAVEAAGRGKLLDPPPPAPLAAARTDRTAGYDALTLAGEADLGALLLDLLPSDHAPLSAAALALLLRLFGQEAALRTAASELQLLDTKATRVQFGKCRTSVRALRCLVEMYELWGGLETRADQRRAAWCAQLLQALTQRTMVDPEEDRAVELQQEAEAAEAAAEAQPGWATDRYGGSTAAPDGAKEKAAAAAAVAAAAAAGAAWDGGVGIGSHAAFFLKVGVTAAAADASWQSALRHLGCVELGLSVLRLPPPAGDAPARELRRLKHAAYALLAALCAGHADSQRAVFEELPLIMEALPDFEEPTLVLLAALVDGNRPLAAALPPSLPLMLVEKHLAARGAPTDEPAAASRALAGSRHRLLLALVAPGGAPLRAVQEIVLHALLTPRPGEPPLDGALAIEPETPAYVQRQEATAPNARGEAARVGQWQLQTLALLAACAHGPSQLAEARLHALYPLRHLLSALLDTATPRPLSAALLPLLQHAHIESQLRPLSLGDHPLLGRLLAAVAASIDRVSWKLPLKSLRAAHGTLHYELAAAVPFVLSLVDGGADGSGPPVGADGALVGTAMDVLAKVSVSEVLMFPRHADLRRRLLRIVPASRSALSTPRRSPLAVRAAAAGGGGASAPAAAMRSLLAASPESTEEWASLLAAIQVAGDADATLSVEAICAAIVRLVGDLAAAPARVALCVDALRLLLGVLNAQEGGAKATLRRRLERGGALSLSLRLIAAAATPPSLFVAASDLACALLTADADAEGGGGGAAGHAAAARVLARPPAEIRPFFESVHERLSTLAEALRVEALEEPLLTASSGGDGGGEPVDPAAAEAVAVGTATLRLVCALCGGGGGARAELSPAHRSLQELLRQQPYAATNYSIPLDVLALLPPLLPPQRRDLPRGDRAALAKLVLDALLSLVHGPNAATQALLSRRALPSACIAILAAADDEAEAAADADAFVEDADAPPPPSSSRELRCAALSMLLALLQGSPQAAARRTLSAAIDGSVLRQRLMAAHTSYLAERARRSERVQRAVLQALQPAEVVAPHTRHAKHEADRKHFKHGEKVHGDEDDAAADHRRKAINLDSLAPAEVAAGLAAEGEEATDDAVGRAVAKAAAVAAAERAAEERADEAEAALLSPAGWEEGKLREGFLVFIVLRSLTEATKALGVPPPDGGGDDDPDGFEGKGGGSYADAKDFFAARTASVEVVFCGELHDVHFPLPSGAHYLPQGYSNTLLRSLERSSSAARRTDLLLRVDEVGALVAHKGWLAQNALAALLLLVAAPVRLGFLANALVVNFLLFTQLEADVDDYGAAIAAPRLIHGAAGLLLPPLLLLELVGAAILLVAHAMDDGPPSLQIQWTRRRRQYLYEPSAPLPSFHHLQYSPAGGASPSVLQRALNCVAESAPAEHLRRLLATWRRAAWHLHEGRVRDADGYPSGFLPAVARTLASALLLLRVPALLYHVALLLCCSSALFLHPASIAGLVVLLPFEWSPALRAIVVAVLELWRPLAWALCLALLLAYVHAAASFYLLGEALGGAPCDTLAACVGASLVAAPLSPWAWPAAADAAVPDSSPTGGARLVLDISYFACVGVLAMGLSAAAFIEAIAAARRREEELLVDLQGRCPVTGLSRDAIERRGGSFDYWVGAKHNALHYIFLVLHLRAKAARGEPFSSLEATIARQARALDPAFLPSLANVEATDGDAADADALARLAEKLAELEGAVRAAGK